MTEPTLGSIPMSLAFAMAMYKESRAIVCKLRPRGKLASQPYPIYLDPDRFEIVDCVDSPPKSLHVEIQRDLEDMTARLEQMIRESKG